MGSLGSRRASLRQSRVLLRHRQRRRRTTCEGTLRAALRGGAQFPRGSAGRGRCDRPPRSARSARDGLPAGSLGQLQARIGRRIDAARTFRATGTRSPRIRGRQLRGLRGHPSRAFPTGGLANADRPADNDGRRGRGSVLPKLNHRASRSSNGFFHAVAAGLRCSIHVTSLISVSSERLGLGWEIDPESPGSIAAAVRTLLGDPDALLRCRERVREARDELSWAHEERELARIIATFDCQNQPL